MTLKLAYLPFILQSTYMKMQNDTIVLVSTYKCCTCILIAVVLVIEPVLACRFNIDKYSAYYKGIGTYDHET